MDDLEFKCFPVKKSCMLDAHEREEVAKDRIKWVVQNKKNEINEPCFVHYFFCQTIKNFRKNPASQQLGFNKRHYDETADLIESHVDACDFFHDLTKDLPLRGTKFIRKNPTLKTRIIAGLQKGMLLWERRQVGKEQWSTWLFLASLVYPQLDTWRAYESARHS